MNTLIQPRLLSTLAAIGLTVLGGCQGIKQSMPNLSMPNILARGKVQRAPVDKPVTSAPQVTERNFAQVQLAMGDSMAKEGNFEAAQSAYEAALRNDDTLARAYHRLALMNEKTGKGRDANELFQRAMQLDPKNAEIACDYGYCCYLRQDWKGAQHYSQRALQIDPKLKRAHNNLGLVYARTNRPDDAMRQFAVAGLSPADARANLGFVYLTEKRFQEAKAELQLAAAANPSSAKAQNILARFEKIETSAQPQQVQAVPAPPQVQTVAASAPAIAPSMQRYFDVPLAPAAETPRVAEVTTPRVASSELAPLPKAETPRVARVEAPRQVMPASDPTKELSQARQTVPRDLPTQQSAPVLSDYQY